MTNIKTLDERIDAHPGATITLDEMLAMSREEAKELRAALEIGIPPSWQLVPKDLTDAMYAIVKEVAPKWNAASIWANLLDAAPQPEDAQ